jgi:UDP-glucose:(heptosyl)LPS alpha-1,3-glucosyltransferase
VKIGLVILHADASRGGAERYTLDLSASLVNRGHEVSLLASTFAEVPSKVTSVPMQANGATRLGRYLKFLQSVDAATTNGQYDIVHAMLPVRHCDVYHPHAGIAVNSVQHGHLKQPNTVGRVMSRWGNWFNLRRQRFAAIEQQLLTGNNAPVVLCLSGQIKATVRQHYPKLPENNLVTLFNATDLSRFDPAALPDLRGPTRAQFNLSDDDVVGLMLAQDFERKGLRQCIVALSKIAEPRLKLLVGGKQNPRDYRNLASDLGVNDRVRFAGPTDNPAAFYRAADFFVLPTRSDPCSLVVLEALAMGVPVISTRQNGACEIMTDGREGRILSDPDDLPGLVSAMIQMLDPNGRKTMMDGCMGLRPRLAVQRHLAVLEETYGQKYRSTHPIL